MRKKPSSDNINECYNMVYEDFKRLKKNTDFDSYIRNKKVKIMIVDNSESSNPLFVNEIQTDGME